MLTQDVIDNQIRLTKQLRKDLDKALQTIQNQCLDSDETNQSGIRLKESIMWLGLYLKFLGEQNPYPDSYNPDNLNVEPTADNLKF